MVTFDLKIEHSLILSSMKYVEYDRNYIFEDFKFNVGYSSKTPTQSLREEAISFVKKICNIIINHPKCPDDVKAKIILSGSEHSRHMIEIAKNLDEAFSVVLSAMSFEPGIYIRDDNLNWSRQE